MTRLMLLAIVAAAATGIWAATQIPATDVPLVTVPAGDAYLGGARAAAPTLRPHDDGALLRVGLGLCEAISTVPNPTAVPTPLDGVTDTELHAITDSATRHLCPHERGKVAAYLDGR